MRRGKVMFAAAAVLASAVAVSRMPGRPVERIPAFAGRAVTVVGHRGAAGLAPENTLPGFWRGLEHGAHALELDVRLSADGHVVVLHDPLVDRTTDGSGPVAAKTLGELRRLDAGYRWTDARGGHPYRGNGLRIPTLREVFDALTEAFLIIELKREAGLQLAAAVVDEVRGAGREDKVALASADAAMLEVVRTALPEVATNLSEREVRALYGLHLTGMHRRWRGAGRVVQVPETHEGRRIITPRFVSTAHDLGLDVQVWTVNDPADMQRLVEWGVDGLVTDYPDQAIEALQQARTTARRGHRD